MLSSFSGAFRFGRGRAVTAIPEDPNSLISTGLVVHVDAGNTSSYPGSGTTWTNLVDSNTYTISDGSFDSADGGSIVFNGTSTFVSIGSPLSNGTDFTKEAWVYADVVTSSRNILSSANNVFWNNGSTLSGGVGGSFSVVTSSSFPAGEWRHVALTFDDSANTMTLYINGVQVSQNTNVTQTYTSEVERIGSHFFSGNPVSFWDGKIAQVRVYNTALSNSNILQNFNVTKSTFGYITANTVIDLDASIYSGSGNWLDQSGNDNDGVANGSPTYVSGGEDYFDFDGGSTSGPGTRDSFRVADDATLESMTDISFEMWLNIDAVQGSGSPNLLFDKRNSLGTGYVGFFTNTGYTFRFGTSSPNQFTYSTTPTTGSWQHLVVTIGSGGSKMYINNSEVASNAYAGNTNNISADGILTIADIGIAAVGVNALDGKIGLFRIYDGILLSTDVTTRWNETKSRFGL